VLSIGTLRVRATFEPSWPSNGWADISTFAARELAQDRTILRIAGHVARDRSAVSFRTGSLASALEGRRIG